MSRRFGVMRSFDCTRRMRTRAERFFHSLKMQVLGYEYIYVYIYIYMCVCVCVCVCVYIYTYIYIYIYIFTSYITIVKLTKLNASN
jgi:hypothetical protein